ncbi:MAG: hypothetical protein PWP24_566 [Clostridiales bacterium]|nr:hypothetical protein [Clostridiales bacterium]
MVFLFAAVEDFNRPISLSYVGGFSFILVIQLLITGKLVHSYQDKVFELAICYQREEPLDRKRRGIYEDCD